MRKAAPLGGRDEQVDGPFGRWRHEHVFAETLEEPGLRGARANRRSSEHGYARDRHVDDEPDEIVDFPDVNR